MKAFLIFMAGLALKEVVSVIVRDFLNDDDEEKEKTPKRQNKKRIENKKK